MAAVATFKYDPARSINYTGTDPEYYPDGGVLVVGELQTAQISGNDLDALELSSGGSIVLTANDGNKAVEVSALGIADPAVVDTTVVDSGTNALDLSSQVAIDLVGDKVQVDAGTKLDLGVTVSDPATPTFRLVADDSNLVVGTGVVDGTGAVSSGSFLQTDATSFKIGHDSAAITSGDSTDSVMRYDATGKHEFFVGPDAASQTSGMAAVEITADKVTIRKDVDLVGTINSIATDQTSLQVEDQVLHLAYTDDPATEKRDILLSQSKTGVTIDTVPGDYAEDATYMGTFKAADGSDLFVDATASEIDVNKALGSGAFSKEFAYYINDGVKTSGGRTPESRVQEPFWNIAGGSLRISHTVPNGDGLAKTYSLAFRLTDTGDMEMVRITNFLQWNGTTSTYEPDTGATPTARVIARYTSST